MASICHVMFKISADPAPLSGALGRLVLALAGGVSGPPTPTGYLLVDEWQQVRQGGPEAERRWLASFTRYDRGRFERQREEWEESQIGAFSPIPFRRCTQCGHDYYRPGDLGGFFGGVVCSDSCMQAVWASFERLAEPPGPGPYAPWHEGLRRPWWQR